MPLTTKGNKIMAAMKTKYGAEQGERVFYASKNKGTITGVDDSERQDANADKYLVVYEDEKGKLWYIDRPEKSESTAIKAHGKQMSRTAAENGVARLSQYSWAKNARIMRADDAQVPIFKKGDRVRVKQTGDEGPVVKVLGGLAPENMIYEVETVSLLGRKWLNKHHGSELSRAGRQDWANKLNDCRFDDMTERDWQGLEQFIAEERREEEHRADAAYARIGETRSELQGLLARQLLDEVRARLDAGTGTYQVALQTSDGRLTEELTVIADSVAMAGPLAQSEAQKLHRGAGYDAKDWRVVSVRMIKAGRLDADFDESKHPRSGDGKFGSGGGTPRGKGRSHIGRALVQHYRAALEKEGYGDLLKLAESGEPSALKAAANAISARAYKEGKTQKVSAAVNALHGAGGASQKELEDIAKVHGVKLDAADPHSRHGEWTIGQRVHLGLRTKGGAGFYGKIVSFSDKEVQIEHPNGKRYWGDIRWLSRSDDERHDSLRSALDAAEAGYAAGSLPRRDLLAARADAEAGARSLLEELARGDVSIKR